MRVADVMYRSKAGWSIDRKLKEFLAAHFLPNAGTFEDDGFRKVYTRSTQHPLCSSHPVAELKKRV